MCQYANWLRYVWRSDLGIGTLRISCLLYTSDAADD